MVKMTINAREVMTPRDRTILTAAREMGLMIPTLCHHEGLSPFGSCRLCIVEIRKKGRTKIVTSCNHPVEEGLEVYTDSARVLTHRKMLMELLLARCPEDGFIRSMAREMGIENTRFVKSGSDCILCGLCVRVCEEKMGVAAISFVNRGTEEEVAAPFNISPESCIGCGACANVCPTKAITFEMIEETLTISRFHTAKRLAPCPSCGKYYGAELHLDWIRKNLGPQTEFVTLCPDCRRRKNAEALHEVSLLLT